MLNLVGLGLRGFMVLASAVVLGLSVTLAKQQVIGAAPAETSFAAFTGGFGILAAAVGITAIFFDSLPSLVQFVFDGLASLFFLAGGIALTMAMKNISCTSRDDLDVLDRYQNKILNGGCRSRTDCAVGDGFSSTDQLDDELRARCVRSQADFAFQYIAFVTALGSVLLTFLMVKRSGGKVFA